MLWCQVRFRHTFVVRFVFTPHVVCRESMSYLCYLHFVTYSGVKNVLTIWVTQRVPYKRKYLHCTCPSRAPGFTPGLSWGTFCLSCLFSVLRFPFLALMVFVQICPMLPVSLNGSSFISSSMFSNVYSSNLSSISWIPDLWRWGRSHKYQTYGGGGGVINTRPMEVGEES